MVPTSRATIPLPTGSVRAGAASNGYGCQTARRLPMRYTAIGPALAMLVVLTAPALPEDIAPEFAISAKLAATLYYTALEAHYPPGQSAPFLDIDGKVLRTASDAFLAAAAIEGTAEFTDGVVLNYAARVGGAVRWMEVERGLDARGCELV